MSKLRTVAQTAQHFGVHVRTIARWIEEGRFPNAFQAFEGLRAPYLIPLSDIEALEGAVKMEQIIINFEHDSIWGDDPSTWEGLDRPASELELVKLCGVEFLAAGLDAKLVISNGRPTLENDNMTEREQKALDIANHVFDAGQWYVNAD
jgi:hypothetical protein